MKNIILIGVQGSGKGTLAKELKKEYNYAHISIGDILRDRANIDDEFGKEIKSLVDNGLLVSNDIILKIIKEKITSSECQNGYILDGFPRSLEQAEGYSKILTELNKDVGIVINLKATKELIQKRVLGRRLCSNCGSIYNIYSNELKPIKENTCNNCGGSLYQRADDNEEALERRVNTYYEVTEPILNYYEQLGVLKTVIVTDDSTVETTLKEVCDLL